jgi:uncharacterized membrane protein YgaE (UPF0421/DUF939 family)
MLNLNNIKSIFNHLYLPMSENKPAYITAFIVTLTVMSSIIITNLFFSGNVIILTWSGILALLLPLSRVGQTKRKQLFNCLEHGFYTLLLINSLALILIYANLYALLFLALLIFLCYSLPQFRKSSAMIGTYLTAYAVIVWSLYSEQVFNASHLFIYLQYQSIGISLSLLLSLLFISLLPIAVIQPPDIKKDYYYYLRALRVTLSIIAALVIADYFALYNSAWICFSALVVIQDSLGSSIEKALNRLLGTALGIIVGIIIVNAFSSYTWLIACLSLAFVFLGCLAIKKNYALGLFFFTLILVAVFDFLKPPGVTVYQYMIGRLSDTFIGILIAIACEILVFPKTFIDDYRQTSSTIYSDMINLIHLLIKDTRKPTLTTLTLAIQDKIDQLHYYTKIVRYEPIVLLSKRYKYVKKLPGLLHHLWAELNQLIANKNLTKLMNQEANRDFLLLLSSIFHSLKQARQNSDEKNLKLIHNHLISLQSLISDTSQVHAILPLAHAVEAILKLYNKIYSTKKWYLQWR